MLHKLIDLSPDLKRLRDEGYEIRIKDSFLLIENVPYINSSRAITFGILITPLTIAGERTGRPDNHVAYFIGEQPCNKDGTLITALLHNQNKVVLASGIEPDRSFSNKPPEGYSDYYHKMTTYINIISGPAQSMDSTITPRTFRFIESEQNYSVFHYPDTNSSRAGISIISDKLKDQRIGIIGVGGTGSYILDFVSKCPVKEIRIFDKDKFLLHNAFRSPGAPEPSVLSLTPKKVEYFKSIYSRMHSNIIVQEEFINSTNLTDLHNLDFVFICIDNGNIKKEIFEYLSKERISFIDVGIGIEISDQSSLLGLLRVTSSINGDISHILAKNLVSLNEVDADDEYAQNIQIAELNALNAALAVIKWKKKLGFYYDAEKERHCLFSIDDNSIINDDFKI